ncbi:hypothetical protein [Rhizobium phaseoli]|uniref:hypothetical protein n=1 Tax=Rhizobium phaseoli TaxID=396 RepID=UPI000BEA2EC6|nr:hypothetical protein [Rhizobium phaseoli]PDS69872.1 hypothetical protein CO651_21905 [Rhizobium phaseoli]
MRENEDDQPVSGRVLLSDIYREQYAHVRSMNDILYKIPPLFTVALGGLWYFAATQFRTDRVIAAGIFLFCVILSISFVHIMERFGNAFNGYLDNLNKLDGEYKVSLKPSRLPSTVKTIQLLLYVSALISLIGAAYVVAAKPTPPNAIETPRQVTVPAAP